MSDVSRSKRTIWRIAFLTVLVGGTAGGAGGAEYSALWGRSGEKWTPKGRLPDFSFAGYHRGETAPPKLKATVSIKDFGAKGDGQTDDTQAFLDAIAKTPRGVIAIPPGRYKITKVLRIAKPNLVLRGAGPRKTILVLPRSLMDVEPRWSATTTGRKTSAYSWSGGFVRVQGQLAFKAIGPVGPAKQGDTTVTLSQVRDVRPGREIRIVLRDDPAKSLAKYLYANESGNIAKLRTVHTSLVARVAAVEGGKVKIDRPLPFDIRSQWLPQAQTVEPTVTEVGIEEMGFEFPRTPYRGHFTEVGLNAIAFAGVAHCWARNVRIFNSDSGIFVSGCVFCTIDGIEIAADRPAARGDTGHHGIQVTGNDNLVTNFNFKTRFIHDITVSQCRGNVFATGRGVDLSFDHHRAAPYANLFTNIDVGKGTQMFRCGGGAALGRHSAALTTFWAIRSDKPQAWPGADFGPSMMNFVGVTTNQASVMDPTGRWFEAIRPEQLVPRNLHEAQRARRLKLAPPP